MYIERKMWIVTMEYYSALKQSISSTQMLNGAKKKKYCSKGHKQYNAIYIKFNTYLNTAEKSQGRK